MLNKFQPETLSDAEALDAYFANLNRRYDSDDEQEIRLQRQDMLTAARRYYDGQHEKRLKIRQGESDPNVIINLCRAIVNKSVSWLFGDVERGNMPQMDLPDDAERSGGAEFDSERASASAGALGSSGEEAEAYLERVWKANGGARLFQRMARRVSIEGHGWLKILPVGDPLNPLDVPRLVLQRGEMVSVLTRLDDLETAEAYVIEWVETRTDGKRVKDTRVRQFIARPSDSADVELPWYVAQLSETGRGRSRWEFDMEPTQWPFAWSPMIDWQNVANDTGYYGLSDLEDLTALNDAINFTVSNINRILYIHGHPRTIGTGFDASEVQDTAIDSFWTVPNEKAQIRNLEMQSDLGSAFAFLQFLSQSFWNVGRDLDVTTLQDRIGQVTNFGLRVLASAAIAKLGEKRLTYGDALNRINRVLLELGGFDARDSVVRWIDPLPTDSREEVDSLKTEIEMGLVSRQTAAEERGRDWQTEQDRMAEEKAGEMNLGELLLSRFDMGQTPGLARPQFQPARSSAEPASAPQVGEAGNE